MVFVASSVLVPVGTVATVLGAFLFLPLPATLPKPKPGVASSMSHVYDINGNEIAIFREYWNNPEKTAQTMLGDWLDTGDTYFRDEDGYYHHCGRSDDMIKVGGMWCSPIEIESRLVAHPSVLEAAVAGIPDASGLIKPEAWVILRDGVAPSEVLAAELMEHCKSQLAPYKFPRRVHFTGELPKTATGKIQRYRLRSNAGQAWGPTTDR